MYTIRKAKQMTIWEVSHPISVDPEQFRNLSIPYTGQSQEEFIKYIRENYRQLEDISEEFDSEFWNKFCDTIIYPDWIYNGDSEMKFENSWFEVVEPSSKVGEWEVVYSNDGESNFL